MQIDCWFIGINCVIYVDKLNHSIKFNILPNTLIIMQLSSYLDTNNSNRIYQKILVSICQMLINIYLDLMANVKTIV